MDRIAEMADGSSTRFFDTCHDPIAPHPVYPGDSARSCARIVSVDPMSPADDAGFTPGCIITSVDGKPIRDILDWRWLTDGDAIALGYIDTDGDSGIVELEREEGEDWGIAFDGAIFDKVRTCRNACRFCFMRQLPEHARPSLSVKDDDFRLSFLQGNFVTLTNLSDEDVDRIIEQRISPLRVSLHAISPDVRERLIGRHAPRGIEALERLLDAGIEFDAQIVLMPGINDGAELRRTLAWAYLREGIVNIGVVPVGYTRHQSAITGSFEDPERAEEVIKTIEAVSAHALQQRGKAWAYAADEFYIDAYGEDVLDFIPPASHYGDFAMFEDGIGLVRSLADEWDRALPAARSLAEALSEDGCRVYYVLGAAQRHVFGNLCARSPLAGMLVPIFVENEYFGGNVDVTGLLCGCDVARAIRGISAHDFVVLPSIMFNADGVTLDDMTVDDIRDSAGLPVSVVSCSPYEFMTEIEEIVRG